MLCLGRIIDFFAKAKNTVISNRSESGQKQSIGLRDKNSSTIDKADFPAKSDDFKINLKQTFMCKMNI